MRILIVASFIPYPPDSGARIRTWEIARRFQRRHQVVFGFHVRSQSDLERADAVRRQGFEVITGWVNTGWRAAMTMLREVLNGGPPLAALRRSEELEEKLARVHAAEPFDVIQVEHFEIARYPAMIDAAERAARSIELHDILSIAYARMAGIERHSLWRVWRRYNSSRLKAFERKLLPGYHVCVTMSERDREQIARLTGPERIHVLPNCVDSLAKPLLDEPANGAPAILLLGLFLHPPNADAARWMLEEIFPLVRGSLPACTLYLVGGGAPRYLERMAAQPGVCLTGRVEDVALSYARCQIAVAPLRAGGGTRLKILEAMSFGRPVVATSTGAEGLPVNSGEHLMLADTAEDFARACVGLLRDPALRSRLRRNARSFVERGYRWDDCAERHLRIYEALIRKGALTPERAR